MRVMNETDLSAVLGRSLVRHSLTGSGERPSHLLTRSLRTAGN